MAGGGAGNPTSEVNASNVNLEVFRFTLWKTVMTQPPRECVRPWGGSEETWVVFLALFLGSIRGTSRPRVLADQTS